ncbi:response regulator transcription factor [Pseudomonas oleovorans]|jgi:DNA-binding NarL/FixJ family response regulator|uniref:Response regulator transcription factor n=1 Tax=Ectopseudomonas oleovorans TaxID=301 RepID=A0A2S7FIV8_ECTOL|nr:response regulator transcription factor [Pseudomonas oleovorans]MCR1825179.1 response regulator transcription factor [Pseudomonas oleovorans]MDH0566411.1 response regulator transcription factor [Pseudomonas oleovorans]PPV34751.1 DNA-binding response regulator [Pseudomonas oleovorans]
MNEPIRLLLADDHEVTRAGFAAMLADCPEFSIVGQAVDGRQALELCEHLQPDIAILDIRMPVLNGLATARLLHERLPAIKVLLFTMYDSPDHLEAAISAGAVGYLLKDASRQEVIDGLRQVAAGQSALNGMVSAQLLRRVVERNQSGATNSALTPRERQVLGLVAGGFTNREIGEKLGITTGTAKAHVERVIGKLGVADRTQAAVQGIALGLVSPSERQP